MENKFFDIVEFHTSDTKNGVLTMIQESGIVAGFKMPFQIKKTLVINNMKPSDTRGGHTHHKTNQIVFAVSGSCTVTLDNGFQKEKVKLDKTNRGLMLYPYVWHTMENFDENTVLLVLADTEYDEKDYIRKYEDFLGFVKK